jgi:serine/threonine-protein phosphatase 6 regulatory ankyrin repeat subunit B
MSASQNGHLKVVELLLKQQADPNIQTKNGYTALMSASQNGHLKVVELLLKQQANPNIQTKDGCTALMYASQNGHLKVVELLLKQQADPNIQKKTLLYATRRIGRTIHNRFEKEDSGGTALMDASQENGHLTFRGG